MLGWKLLGAISTLNLERFACCLTVGHLITLSDNAAIRFFQYLVEEGILLILDSDHATGLVDVCWRGLPVESH